MSRACGSCPCKLQGLAVFRGQPTYETLDRGSKEWCAASRGVEDDFSTDVHAPRLRQCPPSALLIGCVPSLSDKTRMAIRCCSSSNQIIRCSRVVIGGASPKHGPGSLCYHVRGVISPHRYPIPFRIAHRSHRYLSPETRLTAGHIEMCLTSPYDPSHAGTSVPPKNLLTARD